MLISATKPVDLHIHGIDGFDTTAGDPETILRIAECEGAAGVSGVLPSIYPGPIPVMRRQMAAIKEAMERQKRPAAGDLSPVPARILGVHLEGPFLNPMMAGALDAAFFLAPSESEFRRLIEGFEGIVRTVTVAPEGEGAPSLIRAIARSGIIVNMGHSNATFQEAAAGFDAGARGITHLFNAMRPFHHREGGLAGFGLVNDEVYVEVVGDLTHLSVEVLQLVFKVKRPDRVILVSDSVKQTPARGKGVPQAEDGRLLGGSVTLTGAASGLISEGIDEELVTRSMAMNPRALLGLF